MDYGTKNALYSDSGVREYWIVDPEKERVTVYAYEDDAAPSIFFSDQNIPVGIFDTFSICIDEFCNRNIFITGATGSGKTYMA